MLWSHMYVSKTQLFYILKVYMNVTILSTLLQFDYFLFSDGCFPFNCYGICLSEYTRIYVCKPQPGKHRFLPILFLWCCNEYICTNVQEPLQGTYLEVEMLAISIFHFTRHSQFSLLTVYCLLSSPQCRNLPYPTPHPQLHLALLDS